jgi:hypothetical protein
MVAVVGGTAASCCEWIEEEEEGEEGWVDRGGLLPVVVVVG